MRYFFIINPAAGQGRAAAIWERLLPLLNRMPVEFGYALTNGPEEAALLTKDVAEAGYNRIVGVGGDGTLNEIVSGLPPNAALGVIPAGTGNDFAKTLQFTGEAEYILEAMLKTEPMLVDVGRVNGKPFINMVGVGFDAAVAYNVKHDPPKGKGVIPYLLSVFRLLLGYNNTPLTITIDGETLQTKSLLVSVGNGAYVGGGMHMCPRAVINDGLLDICIAGDFTKPECLRHLPKLFKGTHTNLAKVTYLRARHVVIEGGDALYHADGEPGGRTPVEIDIVPSSLQLLVPRSPLPNVIRQRPV